MSKPDLMPLLERIAEALDRPGAAGDHGQRSGRG